MKITNQNPQSPKITTYAKKISTSTVTCSTSEKALLQTEVTSMESAIASVSVVLETIQEQIESKFCSVLSISMSRTVSTSCYASYLMP